ncbi:MAG TPA: sugar phosphate isomerase/epimerase [Armatimonadota bacterium]|nr:sugar phosphate isomerase/epimerase [Armatimonadota bacterium]
MQLCCCSSCLWCSKLEDALAATREAGFDFLELLAIPDCHHVDLRETTADALGAKLRDYGLGLAALCVGPMATTSLAAMRDSLAYIERAIDAAEALDCQRVVVAGSPRDRADWDLTLAAYRRLDRFAQGRPALICLVNCHDTQLEIPEDFEFIFFAHDSPRIRMCADNGHFLRVGISPQEVVRRFGDHIQHVRLGDLVHDQSVALGAGEADLAGFCKALAMRGYGGFLSVAVEISGRDATIAELRASREYALRLIGAQA